MPPTLRDIREHQALSQVAAARNCWVCTGVGRSLCESHRQEVIDRAALFNLDTNHAAFELRQMLQEENGLVELCRSIGMIPLGGY